MNILFTVNWNLAETIRDEGRLHDLAPAGYIVKSLPQESRGGGIVALYNKCLSKQISITATFLFSTPVIRGDMHVDNTDFTKYQPFLLVYTSTK